MRDASGVVRYVKEDLKRAYFEREELPFQGSVSLGNMTCFKITVHQLIDGIFVIIDGHGKHSFGVFAKADYVKHALELEFDSDAKAVADFINAQLGYDDPNILQGDPSDEWVIKI